MQAFEFAKSCGAVDLTCRALGNMGKALLVQQKTKQAMQRFQTAVENATTERLFSTNCEVGSQQRITFPPPRRIADITWVRRF